MNLILKTNKKVGQTPKELLDVLQYQTREQYFHTGNLDVMAEGLMLFVKSRLRVLEAFFKKLPKTYEFDIVFGFSTDTNDLLGIICSTEKDNIPSDLRVRNAVNRIKKQNMQVPPAVSYKNLNTKSKLKRFLAGEKLPKLKPKKTKIYKIEIIDEKTVYKEDLIRKIHETIPSIKKNYRQEEVKESYVKNSNKFCAELKVVRFKARVSSGFYIRSFARDLGKSLRYPVCTYSIKRTKIGFISL